MRGAEGADELAEFHGFIGMAFGFFGAGHLFDVGDGARGDGGGGLRGVGVAEAGALGLWGVGAAQLLGTRGVAGGEVELVGAAFAWAGELRWVRWLGGICWRGNARRGWGAGVLGVEGGGGEERGEEGDEGGFHGSGGWVGRVGPRDWCDHGRSVDVSGAWSRVCVWGMKKPPGSEFPEAEDGEG